MIEGNVIYVSADTVPDPITAKPGALDSTTHDSFVVRVQLDQRDLDHKLDNFRPTPGMPADIFIQTGQRTFFNYLIRPIMDSFSRAFREH